MPEDDSSLAVKRLPKNAGYKTSSGRDEDALTLDLLLSYKLFSISLSSPGLEGVEPFLLPADLSSRANQMCPVNLSLSSE